MPRKAADRLAPMLSALQWDRGRWIWLLLILLLLGAVLGLGDSLGALLRYDRSAIAAGGWWRLLTAHIVHLDAHHLILNELGLVLMWSLFAQDYAAGGVVRDRLERRAGDQFRSLVAESPRDLVCGRFRRAAHGHGCRDGEASCHAGLGSVDTAMGLCAKLAWEQWGGHPTRGVVDAHLYGAACGFAVGAALSWRAAIIGRRIESG